MIRQDSKLEQQIADAVSAYQVQSTGHTPKEVTVVLCEDTLVVTLRGALTPAETALSKTAAGAAQVQEFHRQLFTMSSEALLEEINRITGRHVHEASTEVGAVGGSVSHAFANGSVVQVFLLAPKQS